MDHLARLQPRAALGHRGGIEGDAHSGVAPGQGDGSAEGEPRVGLVTGSVQHHDVPCAAAQRLDQAEVVVVAAVGHVHPRVAVAQVADGLGPQQTDRGLHQPVPELPGELAVEPEVEDMGPEPGLPVGVQVRLAAPERVRRQIPQQQQQWPPRPRPVGWPVEALRVVIDPLPRFPDQCGVRQPHAEADVRRGEQNPVSLPRRGTHQRRDGRPADRRDVE